MVIEDRCPGGTLTTKQSQIRHLNRDLGALKSSVALNTFMFHMALETKALQKQRLEGLSL
jgi:hypothetical protein